MPRGQKHACQIADLTRKRPRCLHRLVLDVAHPARCRARALAGVERVLRDRSEHAREVVEDRLVSGLALELGERQRILAHGRDVEEAEAELR
eukprot:822684-Prymnesium_polylepis.1